MQLIAVLPASRSRRHGRKVIAILTGFMLLACTLLALRHEATVAHVHDARGLALHAPKTESECRGPAHTHIHGLPSQDHELDVCDLTAVAHQAATTLDTPLVTVAPIPTHALPVDSIAATPSSGARLFRVAPKTSPPRV